MELVYFENSYWEDYSVNKEEDALASIYIDGYPYDENAEGKVEKIAQRLGMEQVDVMMSQIA